MQSPKPPANANKKEQKRYFEYDVDERGDLIIKCDVLVAPDTRGLYCSRVDSGKMASVNPFFAALFTSEKFSEAQAIEAQKTRLATKYGSLEEALEKAARDELPSVTLELPYLPFKSIDTPMIADFWRIMHMQAEGKVHDDPHWEAFLHGKRVLGWLADLCILSDRFGGPSSLQWLVKKKGLAIFNNVKSQSVNSTSAASVEREARLRQAIYVCYALDHDPLFALSTRSLIVQGSVVWYNEPVGIPGIDCEIWWHLPDGIEEELRFRHHCILNTINDLQAQSLRAYGAYIPIVGGDPRSTPPKSGLQCRRMYDNSRQCDAFHLGEMIRFFTLRSKTLELHSSFPYVLDEADEEEDEVSSAASIPKVAPRNILDAIATLRSIPEYQVDDNHQGCGPRRQLVPALECIQNSLRPPYVGLCLTCMSSERTSLQEVSWRQEFYKKSEVIVKGERIELFLAPKGVRRPRLCEACEGSATGKRLTAQLFAGVQKNWNYNP